MSSSSTNCQKLVRCNQRAIFCDCCLKWIHAKCAFLNNEEFNALGCSGEPWFCFYCLLGIYPFNNIMDDRQFVAATTDCTDCKTLNFKPFLYDE